MDFKDKYTTKGKKAADPIKEQGKVELTTDAYALAESIEELTRIIKTRFTL